MSKTIHSCLDIAGYLELGKNNPTEIFGSIFNNPDGSNMHPLEAKRVLEESLAIGRKVLPFGHCEGFSYQTGCPGHEYEPEIDLSEVPQ